MQPSLLQVLDFVSSTFHSNNARYITPHPLEGIAGGHFMDLLREAEGQQRHNFEFVDDQIKVGCCV
jgi:hypothetical protein